MTSQLTEDILRSYITPQPYNIPPEIVEFLEETAHGPTGSRDREYLKWSWRKATELLRKYKLGGYTEPPPM